jgi:hypothetical protein
VIRFRPVATTAGVRSLEPPGSTDSGRVTRAIRPATPDRPVTPRSTSLGALPRPYTEQDLTMAAKPKPQPSDEAHEQARRALQTSLDTRQ